MGRAKITVRRVVKEADLILEVVDSRIPVWTRNREIERRIEKSIDKNLIIVLNKSDLVPEYFINYVKELFEWDFPTVYVSTKTRKGSRALRKAIKLYSPEKEKVKIGVVGYPNTGKSSLINLLVGRHKQSVAPIPGETRGFHLIKLSRKYYLIDTPGTFDEKDPILSVIKGCIRPEKAKFPEKSAIFLLNKIKECCPENIKKIYKIPLEDPVIFLKDLAKKHGYFKEKEPDIRRASIKVLNDWIQGKISAWWIE